MHTSGQTFYVGLPEPSWLRRTAVPAFVSHVRLRRLRTLPRAAGRWALDSGGFTELARHGRWTVPSADYAAAVRRYRDEVGGLEWAAPQDWMCEPDMLAKTGLTVDEHQRRTVASYLELRELAPDLPFVPVLQGWTPGQYLHCAELYTAAGVDLATLPRVGIGSVCRRTSALAVWRVVDTIHYETGLRNLHGFGVKTDALPFAANLLLSSDSQAWSRAARSRQESCTEGKRDCRNCLHYALEWADDVRSAAGWTGPSVTRSPAVVLDEVGPVLDPAAAGALFDLVPAGALF